MAISTYTVLNNFWATHPDIQTPNAWNSRGWVKDTTLRMETPVIKKVEVKQLGDAPKLTIVEKFDDQLTKFELKPGTYQVTSDITLHPSIPYGVIVQVVPTEEAAIAGIQVQPTEFQSEDLKARRQVEFFITVTSTIIVGTSDVLAELQFNTFEVPVITVFSDNPKLSNPMNSQFL